MASDKAPTRRDLLRGVSSARALLAGSGLLGACGIGGPGRAASKPEIKGTIQIWGAVNFDFTKDPAAVEIVKDFEAKYPGATVEYTIPDDQSGDKTLVAAAGDTPPDKTSSVVRKGFASYPLPPSGRRVTFGGVHTFIMPKGSKQQAAAWAFVEHLLSPEQNVKFADYYDRIPVRQSVANSEQYVRNDPFRKLAAEEMAGRRWLIPAPGAWSMRSDISTAATDILEKGVSIREALARTQHTLQTKLDAALQAAKG
jgi:ABC-type glycerol-3-phosphate transport system substrate-binding protein